MQRFFKHLNLGSCLCIHKTDCKATAEAWVFLWGDSSLGRASQVVPFAVTVMLLRVPANPSPAFPYPHVLLCPWRTWRYGALYEWMAAQPTLWTFSGVLFWWLNSSKVHISLLIILSHFRRLSNGWVFLYFFLCVLVLFFFSPWMIICHESFFSTSAFSSCLPFIYQALTCFPVIFNFIFLKMASQSIHPGCKCQFFSSPEPLIVKSASQTVNERD